MNNSKNISGTLTLTAGTLTTASNTLTISGTIVPTAGVINTGVSGTLAFAGNSEQTLSASALSSGSVNILTVNAGSKLTTSGSIAATTLNILSSGANGTGTLKDGGTLTSTNSNVQQYLSYARNWYVASPVSNAQAPGSGYTFSERYEAGASWQAISTSNFVPGTGYIALPSTDGQTLTFSTQTGGSLNSLNSPVSVALTWSGASYKGYNLIGNPYPCHLTWTTTFVDDVSNAALINPSIWYRTNAGTTNASGLWSFQTFNAHSGQGVPSGVTGIIPPMQAFWVSAKTAGSLILDSKLTLSHQSSNPLKAPAIKNVINQNLRLQVSNGISTDEALIYFNVNASNGLDAYDSPKMSNNNLAIPEIFTTIGNENLVINGMNAIPFDTEIPLGFTSAQAGSNFSIKASQLSNFDAGTRVILKDYLDITNPVITDLSDGSSYVFSSGVTSNNTSRFAVVFKAPSVTTAITENTKQDSWVSVYGTNQIIVNGIPNVESSVAVYNAVGQKLFEKQAQTSSMLIEKNFDPGVYLVRVLSGGKNSTKKVIID